MNKCRKTDRIRKIITARSWIDLENRNSNEIIDLTNN